HKELWNPTFNISRGLHWKVGLGSCAERTRRAIRASSGHSMRAVSTMHSISRCDQSRKRWPHRSARRCVRRFYSACRSPSDKGRESALLNREAVSELLVWLLSAQPEPVDRQRWQEMIESLNCSGQANERRFLELLRDNGFPLPCRTHYPLPESGTPIAEIDFL